MTRIAGQRIAVLGATGAIGAAIQRHLHARQACAIAMGRSAEKLSRLAGAASETFIVDLDNPVEWPNALASLEPLDGLVIATGRLDVIPFAVLTTAKFTEALEINVVAPAALLRFLLKAQKLKSGASVVFIGSIAGIRGAAGHAAYAASKAALGGLTRTLALELAPRKIRVNVVSPGLIEEGMGAAFRDKVAPGQFEEYLRSYPLGGGSSADIVGAVEFMLSPESRWVTGQDLVVDGGVTLS